MCFTLTFNICGYVIYVCWLYHVHTHQTLAHSDITTQKCAHARTHTHSLTHTQIHINTVTQKGIRLNSSSSVCLSLSFLPLTLHSPSVSLPLTLHPPSLSFPLTLHPAHPSTSSSSTLMQQKAPVSFFGLKCFVILHSHPKLNKYTFVFIRERRAKARVWTSLACF